MNFFLYAVIMALLITIIVLSFKYCRIPKTNCITFITGGVKCGKSTLAVYMSIKKWRQRVRITKFANIFRKIFRKSLRPLPLLYSNIPLSVPYVPITKQLLLRDNRFVYGSVIYLGEISLISNSMNYHDLLLNEKQLLFYKLFGHETRGGYAFIDSQSIADSHYSIKRSIDSYLYIARCIKLIPGIILIKYTTERYTEDGTSVNTYDEERFDNMRWLIIPKKVWKCFDAYCYSSLTDNCPVTSDVDTNGVVDIFDIVSFNNYQTIYKSKGGDNVEKKNSW